MGRRIKKKAERWDNLMERTADMNRMKKVVHEDYRGILEDGSTSCIGGRVKSIHLCTAKSNEVKAKEKCKGKETLAKGHWISPWETCLLQNL